MTLMFETARGAKVNLEGWYQGQPVFLLCNGPSLKQQRLDLLRLSRGIVTAGINNGWMVYKPDLWFCVDSPVGFSDTGWKDPTITKFVSKGAMRKYLHVKVPEGFRRSSFQVGQMPACFYYERNALFNPDTFLTEDTVNWGNPGSVTDSLGITGSRSVMLSAFRILVHLGFTRIYIAGADFGMSPSSENYCFPQSRSEQSIKNNNRTYGALNKRFTSLLPHLDKRGVKVFNITGGGNLTSFSRMDFMEALEKESKTCMPPIETEGWYTQDKREKPIRPERKTTPRQKIHA